MTEVTNFRGDGADENGTRAGADRIDRFIAAVGDRVRQARQQKAISRRVLSELSGVSQRYLAQLETGGGNISIALLYKVAHALDLRVEWLVSEDERWDAEMVQLADLLRSADSAQRQRVIQILTPGRPSALRRNRICLIGLRGAGKSTLGKLLGEALAMPFTELNGDIEEQSGMPVEEVMALYGQEGYRKLEREALERIVATADDVVLAAAGGIVSEPETYGYLLRNFHTIWLTASPAEHMGRVRAQGDERPMAGNPKAMEELVGILTSRETLYARAEAKVSTSGKTVEESLRDVLRAVGDMGLVSQAN